MFKECSWPVKSITVPWSVEVVELNRWWKINLDITVKADSQTCLATPSGWGCFCVYVRGSERKCTRVGMLWNWWIFMLSVPVEWSPPVTNVDRQLSILSACLPAGQIRLITSNKDNGKYDCALPRRHSPAPGPFARLGGKKIHLWNKPWVILMQGKGQCHHQVIFWLRCYSRFKNYRCPVSLCLHCPLVAVCPF